MAKRIKYNRTVAGVMYEAGKIYDDKLVVKILDKEDYEDVDIVEEKPKAVKKAKAK